jgi:transposase
MRRRSFSKEYIERAVRLYEEQSEWPLTQVARNLGVRYGTLYDWVSKARKKRNGSQVPAAPSATAPPSAQALQAENERLRRELEETKKQLEFAKKAAAFFAQQSK